jgi:ADP-heptose:LPS heptosyltransferase
MILISPYSRALRSGKRNPKNYPYWKELISLFKNEQLVQLGVEGEPGLVKDFRKHLPIKVLKNLIDQCDFWISVDNFFPHLSHHVGKPGVVIWGISDPQIFGYSENLNILKDSKNLRANQFDLWDNYTFSENVFFRAPEIYNQIINFFKK